MANGFVNPYQTQLSGLQQKQALAQALMQRGMSAQGMQTPLSSLANIATAMMGAKQYGALGTQQEELAKQQADQQRLEMARALSAYRGDQPYQAETFGPGDVLPQGLKTMGTEQNRGALIQALAESTNPAYQQAALTQMLQPTLMEKAQAKAAETGGLPFSGTGMDAQVYNNLIQYNQKKAQGIATTPQEDMAYNLAYQKVSKPYMVTTPDGRSYQVPGMDVSQFVVPGGGAPQAQMQPQAGPVQGIAAGTEVGKRQYPAGQSQAAGYANRMTQAEDILSSTQAAGYDPTNLQDIYGGAVPGVGGFLTTPEGKLYKQAQEDWVRAKLRKESGAVIGADEMADEIKTYFPQPGDTPEVIAQKERARKIATNNLIQESQGAAGEMFGVQPYQIQQTQQPATAGGVKFLGFE